VSGLERFCDVVVYVTLVSGECLCVVVSVASVVRSVGVRAVVWVCDCVELFW